MILLIIIGGFFGACLRYTLTGYLQKYNHSFPTATLTINLVGSSFIGFAAGLGIKQGSVLHMLIVIGILGAFTTFSTFTIEALELLQGKKYREFWVYCFLSLAGSSISCMFFYLLIKIIGH